jgi:maltokinase
MTLPFADWLPHQRWYAGRDRELRDVRPALVTKLFDDVEHMLLDVSYTDGGSDRYQVVVRWDHPPAEDFVGIARIGHDGDREGYDALYDPDAARGLLALIDNDAHVDNLRFLREPGVRLPIDAPARVGDVEQSNTSVVFDSAAVLKVFRRVPAGVNPDVELGRVLGRAGCPNVAALMGVVEAEVGTGPPLTLAMVSEYARNSAEGWAMATASARDLLAQRDVHADQAGTDFFGEAERLGQAVAAVHRCLATELGTAHGPVPVHEMNARLDAAVAVVPELADHVPAVRAAFQAAAQHPVVLQRVHGDLHLGQVLRTPEQWLLIDFEGEPGQPIEERVRSDSPLRDVAGMLRSFEYAAYQLLVAEPRDPALAARAREWIDRNVAAFCAGYAEVAGFDPRGDAAVLTAYELDKTVYEAGYEARHRPSWLRIPLRSMTRLLG